MPVQSGGHKTTNAGHKTEHGRWMMWNTSTSKLGLETAESVAT